MNVLTNHAPATPITFAPRQSNSVRQASRTTSATGSAAVRRCAFMRANSGDSSTPARIASPTTSNAALARNGSRQPHARNASCSMPATRRNASSARINPAGLPSCANDATNVRLSALACSLAISTAPPHSPPIAMPCAMRSTTSATGATAPACAYVGSRPMPTVPTAMMTSVATSAFLRPTRSPRWPNTRPPNGRANKPTANVPNDASVLKNGSPDGKNSLPKMSADAVA